jgi:hypothetical protein
MTSDFQSLTPAGLLALLAGDPGIVARLAAGDRVRAETPFSYPGRVRPVTVYLTPLSQAAGTLRISDGGDLIKFLGENGMELEADMILSKTVFHAVRQLDGAGITGGQVYLDCTAETVSAGIWHFLQMVAEVIGLRHAKYKDALVQLERRRDADSGAMDRRPR